MKKMIFGVGLLLSGVIGFVGWSIASVLTVQPGASSTVWGCLHGEDWIALLIFAVIAIAGLIAAIRAMKENK